MLRAGSAEFPIPAGYDVVIIENVLFAEETRIMAKLRDLHEVNRDVKAKSNMSDGSLFIKTEILEHVRDLAAIRSALNWASLARLAIARIEAHDGQ